MIIRFEFNRIGLLCDFIYVNQDSTPAHTLRQSQASPPQPLPTSLLTYPFSLKLGGEGVATGDHAHVMSSPLANLEERVSLSRVPTEAAEQGL